MVGWCSMGTFNDPCSMGAPPELAAHWGSLGSLPFQFQGCSTQWPTSWYSWMFTLPIHRSWWISKPQCWVGRSCPLKVGNPCICSICCLRLICVDFRDPAFLQLSCLFLQLKLGEHRKLKAPSWPKENHLTDIARYLEQSWTWNPTKAISQPQQELFSGTDSMWPFFAFQHVDGMWLVFFETQYLAGPVPGQRHPKILVADFKDLKSIWHMEIELWKKYKKGKHQTVFEVRNPPTISVISVYRWKPPASMLISLPSSEMFFHQQEDPICHIFSVWVLRISFLKAGGCPLRLWFPFWGSHNTSIYAAQPPFAATASGPRGSTSLTKRYSDIPNIKLSNDWAQVEDLQTAKTQTWVPNDIVCMYIYIYIYVV